MGLLFRSARAHTYPKSGQFPPHPRALRPLKPRGVLPNKGVGGWLGPHIKFRGKIWGKVRPSSPNKRKIWEVLLPQDAKVGKSPDFGVISEIQRVKFGAFVTYIFGGKIWGSNKNFRGKFWAIKPPDLLIWKYPLVIKMRFLVRSGASKTDMTVHSR